MNEKNKNLVSAVELKRELNNRNIKIIDARWFLEDSRKGKEEFEKLHIPNAIFFDINKLSDKSIDVPHMLPQKPFFKKYLDKNGLSKKDTVIVYDQVGFFSSARAWFTFKYFGFDEVKILNGGFLMWEKKKFPTDNKINQTESRDNKIYEKKVLLEKKAFIENNINNKKIIVLDARSKKRFLGVEKEPRKKLKSGNIPNSVNIPHSKLSINGKFLSKKDLNKIFNDRVNLKNKKKIICTCGSGITACNLIFALDILGYNNVKLYDGSWAEWGKK